MLRRQSDAIGFRLVDVQVELGARLESARKTFEIKRYPGAQRKAIVDEALAVAAKIAKYNLLAEEWGGKTIVVEISSKTGVGIDKLLDMILLQAEMLDLKADPSIRAQRSSLTAFRPSLCSRHDALPQPHAENYHR